MNKMKNYNKKMTTKVKIWSRKPKEQLMEEVNNFIAQVGDDNFVSANLTGDQGVMVVYKE